MADEPAFAPSPLRLSYIELTSDVTGITNTAFADIPGAVLPAFVAPVGPVLVRFYCPKVTCSGGAPTLVTVGIFSQDNATEYIEGGATVPAAGYNVPCVVERHLNTLTPGQSYQLKARVSVLANTAKLFAGAPSGPTYLGAWRQ